MYSHVDVVRAYHARLRNHTRLQIDPNHNDCPLEFEGVPALLLISDAVKD